MSPERLTLDEAAAELRVSKRTVRRWIDDKKLPAKRVADAPNGRLLIERADVLALLQDAR